MNYFRYISFLTLRHHNPNAVIELSVGAKHGTAAWPECSQDFHHIQAQDFTKQIHQLCDIVLEWDGHQDKAPNFQSDFFRWETLYNRGGWYVDSDQVFLKPFDDFSGYDYVYAAYDSYYPVGVIGASVKQGFCKYMSSLISARYDPTDYNSIGPWAHRYAVRNVNCQIANSCNSWYAFYPLHYSSSVGRAYGEEYTTPAAHAVHLFGAHPESQQFASTFTPGTAKTGTD